MEPALVHALQERRPDIRAHWEALLWTEPVNTPLANPAILVRLFDYTLDQVFGTLQDQPAPRRSAPAPAYAAIRAICTCDRNPLLAYFLAGEQALLETLVLLEASAHGKQDHAATELHLTIRRIARREVESFCSLCQYRRTTADRRREIPRRENPSRRREMSGSLVGTLVCAPLT